jgi:hypothetical protein
LTSADGLQGRTFWIYALQIVDDINNNELVFNMMRHTASLWAKIATQKSLLRGKNVLTLEHVRARSNVEFAMADREKKFMQKKKALGLWREIMRAIISTSIASRSTLING